MRRRRPWSITFVGLRFSSAVIESMMPSSRFMSLSASTSSRCFISAAHAGDHAHDFLQRAEPADLAHLLAEVVERELALLAAALPGEHFVLVELALGLFDEREDVAQAEDAARHPVGVEFFERVEMLADADELDRHAGDVLDREGGAAAGVAVELGQDDAVEFQRFVERLGAVDRVLAGHAVDDQQHLVGRRLAVDRA